MDKYRIVVLAFGSGEVDVIDVDKEIIDNTWHRDVESYLQEHCQYDLDNIQWMQDDANKIRINTLDNDSFEGGYDTPEEAGL